MKQFNFPHKWALTGTLLAILAVNVSFSPGNTVSGTIDFASTSAEQTGKINISDGVTLNVRYFDNGNGTVTAIVPKTNTEGELCNCGFDSFSLKNTQSANDIGALNIQLMQVLTAVKKGEPAPTVQSVDIAEEDVEVSGEEAGEEISVTGQALAAITRKCENKRDTTDALRCYNDNFQDLLQKNIADNLDPAEVYEFYKAEIEGRLVEEMQEARRIHVARLRNQVVGQYDDYETDTYKDPQEMISEGLRVIQSLLANTPKRFDRIRSSLVQSETAILAFQTKAIRETSSMAQQYAGTPQGFAFQNLSNQLYQEYTQNVQSLQMQTFNSISEARMNGIISVDREMALRQQFINNIPSWNVLGSTTAYDPTMVDFTGRVTNPGRGNVVIVTDPATGVSTRGIVTQSAGAQPGILSVTQDPSGNVTLTPPTTMTNLVFGPISPVQK